MTHAPAARPDLTPALSGPEFVRWYWLRTELVSFARELGVSATGGKDLLAFRISAALAARAFAEPPPARRPAGRQLSGILLPETVIPVGQRSSQVVRAWMLEQIGAGFHSTPRCADWEAYRASPIDERGRA